MRLAGLVAVLFLMAAAPVTAQSPFDGTWKFEPAQNGFSPRTYDISLQNGVYSCRSCSPAWTVAADGKSHPVTGHEDYDETSIGVVDDSTVISRESGMGEQSITLSTASPKTGNSLSLL